MNHSFNVSEVVHRGGTAVSFAQGFSYNGRTQPLSCALCEAMGHFDLTTNEWLKLIAFLVPQLNSPKKVLAVLRAENFICRDIEQGEEQLRRFKRNLARRCRRKKTE